MRHLSFEEGERGEGGEGEIASSTQALPDIKKCLPAQRGTFHVKGRGFTHSVWHLSSVNFFECYFIYIYFFSRPSYFDPTQLFGMGSCLFSLQLSSSPVGSLETGGLLSLALLMSCGPHGRQSILNIVTSLSINMVGFYPLRQLHSIEVLKADG